MGTVQPAARRLYLRTIRAEESPDGFTTQSQLIDLDSDEVAWERSGFVRRMGPLRFDYSVLYRHRRELQTYLQQHPEAVLCERPAVNA